VAATPPIVDGDGGAPSHQPGRQPVDGAGRRLACGTPGLAAADSGRRRGRWLIPPSLAPLLPPACRRVRRSG
jgi:hypothetical protein